MLSNAQYLISWDVEAKRIVFQDHCQPHREFKASLGYVRLCLGRGLERGTERQRQGEGEPGLGKAEDR